MPEQHRTYVRLLPPVGDGPWRQHAWCFDCDWQGPVRDTDAASEQDRAAHARCGGQLRLFVAEGRQLALEEAS